MNFKKIKNGLNSLEMRTQITADAWLEFLSAVNRDVFTQIGAKSGSDLYVEDVDKCYPILLRVFSPYISFFQANRSRIDSTDYAEELIKQQAEIKAIDEKLLTVNAKIEEYLLSKQQYSARVDELEKQRQAESALREDNDRLTDEINCRLSALDPILKEENRCLIQIVQSLCEVDDVQQKLEAFASWENTWPEEKKKIIERFNELKAEIKIMLNTWYGAKNQRFVADVVVPLHQTEEWYTSLVDIEKQLQTQLTTFEENYKDFLKRSQNLLKSKEDDNNV